MNQSNNAALETVILDTLARCEAVRVSYLFGSAAKRQRGPMSDIDVGVLFDVSTGVADTAGRLQDALCRALKTDRVDMVILSEAPPSLAYRVIRDGRCILCRSQRDREAFEARAVMRYLDFRPVRDRAFRTARECILGAV